MDRLISEKKVLDVINEAIRTERFYYGDKDWGLPFCPNCGQKLNWERSE